VENNGQGNDPYAYVKGNPETAVDPTGHGMCNADGDCTHGPGAPPPSDPTESGGGSTGGGSSSGGDSGPGWCNSVACFDGNGNVVYYKHPTTPTTGGGSGSGGSSCGGCDVATEGSATQTPPTTTTSSSGIKDSPRFWLGVGKIATGVGTVVASFLSFSNPVISIIATAARFMLKNALAGVVWWINDGMRDILASLTHVSPQIRVWVDIAAIVLDVISIAINVVSTVDLIRGFSLVRNFTSGMRYLTEISQNYIAKKGIGPLATSRLNSLGALLGNDVFGGTQLATDVYTLQSDWASLPS
jgi:hypothetical protein